MAWLVGPWRVGGRVRCIASRPGVPRTTRYLRLWSRGLLLALLRPASGTALVALVRVVMRMFLLVAVRRCVAALRESGYRRRQCEAGKTSAKEHTHRDCRRFPHASPPQRPAKRRPTVLGCEAAQHPCERIECMMDARLGAMIEKEGDDDCALVSAIYRANVASTPRSCARWRPNWWGAASAGCRMPLTTALLMLAACDRVQIVGGADDSARLRAAWSPTRSPIWQRLPPCRRGPSRNCSTPSGTASTRGKQSWNLPKASIGSPAPPLPRLCSAEGSWRRKSTNEKNGSAQKNASSRGASQDHGASRLADRTLLVRT